MKKSYFLTILFSLLLNSVLFSQLVIQNGSFEDPDDDAKYRADGAGGATKLNGNLPGWWADASATDCGREAPRTVGEIPDGKYVGFAFNNDGGSIWNLAGTVEAGMRNLELTFYVQESWPQDVTMSIVVMFATYEGTDTIGFTVVDSLGQAWDKTLADANGFVLYEYETVLPASTEGKNLLIGYEIVTDSTDNTWVNFDNFDLAVTQSTGIQSTSFANTRVYPNPANEFIAVDTKTNELSEYRLIDITGKEILSGFIESDERIDVSSLNKGIYFLNIKNTLGSAVIKTVIK